MADLFKDKIFIPEREEFRPHAVFECGQLFRYERNDEGYTIFSGDKMAKVCEAKGGYDVLTSDPLYFYNYLDLDRDYEAARCDFSKYDFMVDPIRNGKGIRILKQQHFETLISFIISANNHIPRIKGIINRLCEAIGKDMGSYHAFPTAEAMASENVSFYESIGAGYRAPYLQATARSVVDGFNLEAIESLQTEELTCKLCSLLGVGPKVADCVALFSYSRFDVFPVDTWMKKVYVDLFNKENNPSAMRKDFRALFGSNCGLAQQYLFYNKRD